LEKWLVLGLDWVRQVQVEPGALLVLRSKSAKKTLKDGDSAMTQVSTKGMPSVQS
jgi:hypothetical protein